MEDVLYTLKKGSIKLILAYYVILFLLGLFLALVALLPLIPATITLSKYGLAIIGSVGMSLIGSSTYYIRKVYKSCIKGTLKESHDESISLQQLGLTVYFYMRPLFAIGFSILSVVGLNAGILSVHEQPQNLSTGFVCACMFLSFFVGFLSGDFIHILERFGRSLLDRVFQHNTGD